MKQITYGSVCSGIEAASMAWEKPLGWKPLWFSEIEPFPCEVLKHHYPHVPNLGDMTTIAARIKSGEVEAPDILVGGTPCFTADHLVLADEGYKPIQDILPGDMVVTHEGRLKKVVRIGSKMAKVGKLTSVGIPEGIVCTPKHKFLSVLWRNQPTSRNGKHVMVEHCGEPEWTHAENLIGKQYCSLITYNINHTEIKSTKYNDETAMYLAGAYLGDGYIRRHKGKNKKGICFSLNENKYEKFKVMVGDTTHSVSVEGSVRRVTTYDTVFAEWLLENFREYSHKKTVPAWVLSHPLKNFLLQGYLDTDGTKRDNGIACNSTSRLLAYGIKDLLNSCGYVSSVGFVKTSDTCVIEGRTVNQRDYWQVRGFIKELSRQSRTRYGFLLRKVKGYQPYEQEEMVYNIEVEDDNSYILNGAIVHNCQSWSNAGLRGGLSDPRGQLTLAYGEILDAMDDARLIRGLRPSIAIWENVPGIFSSTDNGFGCFLGKIAGESSELQPPGGRWKKSGFVCGRRRTVAWRVIDSQYYGVAQRRKRVFVVAGSRDDINPIEILFEFESKTRNPSES